MMTQKSIRILLTGSSGFLGQHFLNHLVTTAISADDICYQVHALYRSLDGFATAAAALSSSPKVVIHPEILDFTDTASVDAWIEQQPVFDVCIHTAALSNVRVCQENPVQAAAVNNPQHFFEALYQKSPHLVLIAMSTDHVYVGTLGQKDGLDRDRYLETDTAGPCNQYGKSKLAMEQQLLSYASATSDRTVVILRSSIILGPKAPIVPENVHATFLHFIATRQGQETDFFTDEKRNVVAVDDVVQTLLWFVQESAARPTKSNSNNLSGVYNLGGPDSLSRMEMARAVFDHLGFDPKHLVAKKKAEQPPSAAAPSPLDISMDSSNVQTTTGLSFRSLKDVLPTVFPTGALPS